MKNAENKFSLCDYMKKNTPLIEFFWGFINFNLSMSARQVPFPSPSLGYASLKA